MFLGWGKRRWRTWLGLYLDKKNTVFRQNPPLEWFCRVGSSGVDRGGGITCHQRPPLSFKRVVRIFRNQ